MESGGERDWTEHNVHHPLFPHLKKKDKKKQNPMAGWIHFSFVDNVSN
jgi:hypothetical protein